MTDRLFWAGLAIATGALIGLSPPWFSVLVLGSLLSALLFYLKPALALVLMLCLAPLKTLIETENPLPLPLDIGQICFFLALGFWALHYVTLGAKFPLAYPIPLLTGLSLFIFAASLSFWTAYSSSLVIKELMKWVQILFLVFLVANTRPWTWVLGGLMVAAALQAIIGLWQFQGGSGAAHLWILNYRFFRAFGTFGQPNPFGAFMGMVLPLGVGLSLGHLLGFYQKRAWESAALFLAYACLTGLIAGGLLVSWSRGAWIGSVAALGALLWAFPPQKWLGTGLIFGGAAGLLILGNLGLLPSSFTNRLTGFGQDFVGFQDVRGVVISDANYAVIERLAHWQSAIYMAESSPWLGLGFGNYEQAYSDFALINWRFALGHAHNYYLNLWAETGFIGLLAYAILWGVIFHLNLQVLSRLSEWWERGLAAGLLGTWVYIAIHSLLDKLYVNNLFLHLGIMLGILAVLHHQTRTSARDGIRHTD